MIYAFDTYYYSDKAKTVGIGFERWDADDCAGIWEDWRAVPDEYVSGAFYKRELPCLLQLLARIQPTDQDIVVVDGFVVLDDAGKPGLGGRLFESLDASVPVIGVAKSNFAGLNLLKREVLRGDSARPLYITAIGIGLDLAADHIRQMKGAYRIPDLLKKLDQLTRTNG